MIFQWGVFFQILMFWLLAGFTISFFWALFKGDKKTKNENTENHFTSTDNVVLIYDTDGTFHDAHTLSKVYASMNKSGLNIEQATLAVNEIMNDGVVFRERIKPAVMDNQVKESV